MKKSILILLLLAMVTASLTGCVKIIDKGTEGQYTGEVAFDAAADSSNDWTQVVDEITGNAQELASVIEAGIPADGAAVSGTGTVSEFISKANGKKNSLVIALEGYEGDAEITMQIGSIYSGTAIRDVQTLKSFGSFTNQTEWSEYAKALNAEMDAQVVQPLGIDESVQGKKITFVGAATASGSEVTITPVSITIE